MSKLICAILLVASCVCSAREIVLTKTNAYVLATPISAFGLMLDYSVIQQMSANTKGPVYVLLYSPGGDLDPLLEIGPELAKLKNVSAIVLKAASAAAAISQLLPGKRYMLKNGELLFHKIRIIPNQDLTFDVIGEIWKRLQKTEAIFDRMCNSRLKISPAKYNKHVTNKDWMLDANEALTVGAIDEIVTVKCDKLLENSAIVVETYSPLMGFPKQQNICDLLEKE